LAQGLFPLAPCSARLAMAMTQPISEDVSEEFFRRQREDPANRECCDGGSAEPLWASISHGIYLSIEAAGVHRSLGVKVSFVQSTTMDAWTPLHMRMMELGGNQRFTEFLREQGVPEDLPIREKYSTRAAQWYRESLRAAAEDTAPPAPLPPGTGSMPAIAATSGAEVLAVLDRVFADAVAPLAPLAPRSCVGALAPTATEGSWPVVSGSDARHPGTGGSLCGKVCEGLRAACGLSKRVIAEENGAGEFRGLIAPKGRGESGNCGFPAAARPRRRASESKTRALRC